MGCWRITLPVCRRVILRLRHMGDARGPSALNPVGCHPCGMPTYGMTPPGGGLGANTPVAGANLLLAPNWPPLKAFLRDPRGLCP
jgi:hypothetical protein